MGYAVGEIVVHCRDGLAKILSITNVNGNDFYTVVSQRDYGETIYVPVERADNIIRSIMTQEQADELIDFLHTIEFDFNKNTKQRRDLFKKKLASGDPKELGYLLRQRYLYKQYPEEVKLGPVDIDILEYATNNFLDEFALTYHVARDKIDSFIGKKII